MSDDMSSKRIGKRDEARERAEELAKLSPNLLLSYLVLQQQETLSVQQQALDLQREFLDELDGLSSYLKNIAQSTQKPQATPPPMPIQYEYRTVNVPVDLFMNMTRKVDGIVQQWASKGWELVSNTLYERGGLFQIKGRTLQFRRRRQGTG